MGRTANSIAELQSADLQAELNRNAIINGALSIWQRGTSFSATGFTADRFHMNRTGSTDTVSRQAFAEGQTQVAGKPMFFMRHVVASAAAAGNYARFGQAIEQVGRFSGGKVVVSFDAKADAAKNIALELTQDFGAGGSTSVTGIGSQLVALTTGWKRYKAVFTVPNVIGKTVGTGGDDCLSLNFWLDAGSTFATRAASLGQQSGTFDFANIKLERGDIATPFQRLTSAMQLNECMRFYEKSYELATAPAAATSVGSVFIGTSSDASSFVYVPVRYSVPKRSKAGTVSIYTVAGTSGNASYTRSAVAATNVATAAANQSEFGFYAATATIGAANAAATLQFQWESSAELTPL